MKKIFKRIGTVITTLVMAATTTVAALPVNAANGDTIEIYVTEFPRQGDDNADGTWGHGDLTYMNGYCAHEYEYTEIFAAGEYWTDQVAYCIEPGTSIYSGATLTEKGSSYFTNLSSNGTISGYEIQTLIGRILTYGYQGNVSIDWVSQNSSDADKIAHAYATQLLIWETVVGERDEDFNHVSTGSYDAIFDCVSTKHPLYSEIKSWYNSIVSSVKEHTILPSFCTNKTGSATTVDLEWDGSEYTTNLQGGIKARQNSPLTKW